MGLPFFEKGAVFCVGEEGAVSGVGKYGWAREF